MRQQKRRGKPRLPISLLQRSLDRGSNLLFGFEFTVAVHAHLARPSVHP
jgi:hypothetical protein